MVRKSVEQAAFRDPHVKKEIFSHIVLSGGTTKLSGFTQRLKAEISQMVPDTPVAVWTLPCRDRIVFEGAKAVANSGLEALWINRADYLEEGENCLKRPGMYLHEKVGCYSWSEIPIKDVKIASAREVKVSSGRESKAVTGRTSASRATSRAPDVWKDSLCQIQLTLFYPDIDETFLTPCGAKRLATADAWIVPDPALDQLLDSADGLEGFWDFLMATYTAENLLFYREAWEILSKSPCQPGPVSRLFDQYIADNAPSLVTVLDERRRVLSREVKASATSGTVSELCVKMLKECQADSYHALKAELFPRFLASPVSEPWRARI